MQVKKFEAKTMKEAIEMVKIHMGPDAVILSAKDHSRSFGLIGEKSVEVTAAVSEETLKKKRLVEQRLTEGRRKSYQQSSAKVQRQYIDKYFERYHQPEKEKGRGITGRPYIEIVDELEVQSALQGAQSSSPDRAQERIRSASSRAWNAVQQVVEGEPQTQRSSRRRLENEHPNSEAEMMTLRREIAQLKGVIEKFSKVPQTFVSRHPGADYGISYELSFMFEKLRKAGLSMGNTVEILKKAQERVPLEQLKKKAMVDAWVARHIMDEISIAENRTDNRMHVFVGPSAQGKTSSLVKLASHMVICEKRKIAIISTDAHKVGAAEQLRIFAQILNVPFALIKKKSDWNLALERLQSIDHILVDMPGSQLKSMGDIDQMRSLVPPDEGGRSVHYVQSVLARDEDALAIAKRYMKHLAFDDVIFTCLDETFQHGLIYNFYNEFRAPLHSFGIGSQIPEDFEPATRERVIDLIFRITKVKKGRGIS